MGEKKARPGPDRPRIEKSYGIPEDVEGLLPWSHLSRRMAGMRNYWVSTVKPDSGPHAVPVWGVWVDETFYFGGGRQTHKAKNLAVNPNVAVHSESGDDVVILEGEAVEITESRLLERVDDAYEVKYGIRHGTPVWAVKPRMAFAWSEFPRDATRWTFG